MKTLTPQYLKIAAFVMVTGMAGLSAQATPISAGTITTTTPGTISIHSVASTTPQNYTCSPSTTYVDENGAPVSKKVRSGDHVTVFYNQDGDKKVASKVMLRHSAVVETTPPTQASETTGSAFKIYNFVTP